MKCLPALMYGRYHNAAEIPTQDYLCEKKAMGQHLLIDRKFYDRIMPITDGTSFSGLYDLIERNRFLGGVPIIIAHDGLLDNVPEQLIRTIENDGGRWLDVLGRILDAGAPAVIYARAGCTSKTDEDTTLSAQELACRQYVYSKGWTVVGAFRDHGAAGAMVDRPGLFELMDFIDGYRPLKLVTESIGRLARNVELYIQIKRTVEQKGGEVVCTTQPFTYTPEEEFIDRIIAAQAEFERHRNIRRIKARMQARLQAD